MLLTEKVSHCPLRTAVDDKWENAIFSPLPLPSNHFYALSHSNVVLPNPIPRDCCGTQGTHGDFRYIAISVVPYVQNVADQNEYMVNVTTRTVVTKRSSRRLNHMTQQS